MQQEQAEELRLRINDIKKLEQLYQVVTEQKEKQTLTLLLLDINTLRMTRSNMYQLTEIIAKQKQLRELRLFMKYNSIALSGIEKLGLSLTNIQLLSTLILELQGNRFHDIGLKTFGQCLSQYKSLQNLRLGLRGNQLTSDGLIDFCQSLQNLNQINELNIDLSYNWICEKGALAILDFVKTQKDLHILILDFEQNDIDKGVFFREFINFDHFFTKFSLNFGIPNLSLQSQAQSVNSFSQREIYKKMEDLVGNFYKITIPKQIAQIYQAKEDLNDLIKENSKISIEQLIQDLICDEV